MYTGRMSSSHTCVSCDVVCFVPVILLWAYSTVWNDASDQLMQYYLQTACICRVTNMMFYKETFWLGLDPRSRLDMLTSSKKTTTVVKVTVEHTDLYITPACRLANAFLLFVGRLATFIFEALVCTTNRSSLCKLCSHS